MTHAEHDGGKHWYEWLPGWVPVCAAIFGAALWIGQYTQGVNDRLRALEDAVRQMQTFLYAHAPAKSDGIAPPDRIAP